MDTTSTLISVTEILLQPALWWLWETLIVFTIWTSRFLKPYGKIKAYRIRQVGNRFIGSFVYVPNKARKFTVGKTETHTMELESSPFTESGFFSTPTVFYNPKLTRPMQVEFKDIEHGLKVGGQTQWNPDSEEFDKYATKLGFFQLLRANSTAANFGILMIVVMMGLGLAIGYIVYPMVNPTHTVYVPIPTNGTSIHT